MRKVLAAEGGEVTANGPAEFARYLASETKRWARVIAEMNIKVDR